MTHNSWLINNDFWIWDHNPEYDSYVMNNSISIQSFSWTILFNRIVQIVHFVHDVITGTVHVPSQVVLAGFTYLFTLSTNGWLIFSNSFGNYYSLCHLEWSKYEFRIKKVSISTENWYFWSKMQIFDFTIVFRMFENPIIGYDIAQNTYQTIFSILTNQRSVKN